MFLSLSARFLVNLEAMNMIESIGNITRHRRAPIVFNENGGYTLKYVPVISGENLAHAYQAWLAEIANEYGLNVCEKCSMGIFVKHSVKEQFGNKSWERELLELANKKKVSSKDAQELVHKAEKMIIKGCVVEDIGGFLFTDGIGGIPIKRTSKFQVGYMVPAMDDIKASALEAQFHVRHVPGQKGEEAAQAIYYVEAGSAIYVLQFNLFLKDIGYTSMLKIEEAVDKDERRRRVEVAIKALAIMLESRLFGAKLTRFNPIMDLRSIVLAISEPKPFTVSSGHRHNYLIETVERSEKFVSMLNKGTIKQEENVKILFINNETDIVTSPKISDEVIEVKTISEMFENVLDFIKI